MGKRLINDLKAFYPAIIAFAIYNIIVRKMFHAYCPFLILTGFPCAGCGMTRAVFYILTGRIRRGMALNPAAPMWIVFLLWFFAERYLRGGSACNGYGDYIWDLSLPNDSFLPGQSAAGVLPE